MALMWTPQPIDVYRDWHARILDEASDSLSDWETNFMETIGNQLEAGRTLTQGQAEKLEEIYADKTQ